MMFVQIACRGGVGVPSDMSALPGQQKSQRKLPGKGERVQVTKAVEASCRWAEAGGQSCSVHGFSRREQPRGTLLPYKQGCCERPGHSKRECRVGIVTAVTGDCEILTSSLKATFLAVFNAGRILRAVS